MFISLQEGLEAIRKDICGEFYEEQGIYVPAQGKFTTLADETSFTLAPLIKKFAGWNDPEADGVDVLWSPNLKVLLLLGDAGSGKSVFCQELIQQLWKDYKPGQPIPLRVNLPQCQNPLQRAIEETLEGYGFTAVQIAQLKREQRFFFIIDGYDELHQWQNLSVTNHLGEWQAKTLITCRSQALYGVQDADKYFMPFDGEKRRPELMNKVYVAPFTPEQIETYLLQYNTRQKVKSPFTRAHLESIPGLPQLITTPFLLHLAAEALPAIQERYQGQAEAQYNKLTQAVLYDLFIEQWFQRQETKLKASGHIPVDQDPKPHFWRYCQSLAQQMYLQQASMVMYKPSGRGGLLDTNQKSTSPWAVFFESDQATAQVRSACPLKLYGQHCYSFWHASLIEYFATRAVYVQAVDPLVVEKKQEESKTEISLFGPIFLHQKLFTTNINMLRFLADRVGESEPFKTMLYRVIEHSKFNEHYAVGAANAISVLNAAGEDFSNQNFNAIRIPHADLSGAVLDGTQLQGADVIGVNLKGAWLREANFARAKMNGIKLSEYPGLYFKKSINVIAYSAGGQWFAVGSDKFIYLHDTLTCTLRHTFEGHTNEVTSIAFGPGDTLASGSYDKTIRLWDLKTKKELVRLEHTDMIIRIAFGPGDTLASGNYDNTVCLWDLKAKKELGRLEGHTKHITSIAFGPEDTLASGGDNTVRLWDLKTKKELARLEHTSRVTCIAFGPGDMLASGGWDSLRLWDVKAKKELARLHTGSVRSIAFGPEDTLASGGEDNIVRLWDLKTKKEIARLEGHTSAVTSIAFGPGDTLASGSGEMRLWDLKAKKELARGL